MQRCKTCKHWLVDHKDHNEESVTGYNDPISFEPVTPPFEVRICKHPAQRFCERPVEANGFAVADGSTYFAALATAEDFGCVRHEEA